MNGPIPGGRVPRTGGALAAAVVLVAVLAGACSSGTDSSSATTTTEQPTTTTAPPETTTSTSITIVTVPGTPRTPTTVVTDFGPGAAQIAGTVVGPSGPVDGATVRIERAVGDTVTTRDLTTGGGGSFAMTAILGGRYQVRAWKAPDLAQRSAETFFLTADESRTLQLRLDQFGSLNVDVTADGDPLPAGEPFNVTVLVYEATVSDDGELVARPIPGPQVIVTTGERLTVVGSDRAIANGQGQATFRMQCRSAGGTTGEVFTSGGRWPLGLPPCAEA